MATSDSIADMLTRIRNASLIRTESVFCEFSKMKVSLLELFQRRGFIKSYEVYQDKKNRNWIKIYLRYSDINGKPALREIKRISKPSRRFYVGFDKIPRIQNGYGMVALSTSKGILSDSQARSQRLGGELICMIL